MTAVVWDEDGGGRGVENNNVSRRASIMARQSTLTTDPTC